MARTLFGRNTTGGALLVNTNDPNRSQLSGRVEATYGRFNERSLAAVANLPIIQDKVALRLAAQRLLRDGYTRNSVGAGSITAIYPASPAADKAFQGSPNGLKLDDRDRWNFRGKLLFRPGSTSTSTTPGAARSPGRTSTPRTR